MSGVLGARRSAKAVNWTRSHDRASAGTAQSSAFASATRHFLHVMLFHPRMQRQGQLALREFLGERQPRARKVLAVVGKLMDRRVVDRGLDFGFPQFVDHILAVDLLGEDDRHDMMGGEMVRRRVPGRERQAQIRANLAQKTHVGLRQVPALGIPFAQVLELKETDRGTKLVHPIIVAEHGDVIGRNSARAPLERAARHSMAAHLPDLVEHLFVLGEHHPALGRRHVLVSVETESCGIPERAGLLGARGMGCILDEQQAAAAGEVTPGGAIDRVARVMHDDHGPGARGAFRGRIGAGHHRQIERLDVDEYGSRSGIEDAVRGGDEGERRHEDLVAGSDAQSFQDQVERGRAGIHGDRVARVVLLGEGAFEGANPIPHGDPAAVDDLGEGRLLLLPKYGLRDHQHRHSPARRTQR